MFKISFLSRNKKGVDKIKFKIESLCNTADPNHDDYSPEDMTLRFCKIVYKIIYKI